MAKILETLVDRRGNIIPNTKVFARLAVSPFDDAVETTSDAFGNYELTVSNSAAEYHIWVIEETEVDSSNYIGKRISSGNSISSFSLCADPSWNAEHYGLTGTCGLHKDTTHDSVLLNTGGYLKSFDSAFRLRVGSDTDELDILDIGNTFWFQAKPNASASNVNIGLAKGYDSSASSFYFGTTNFYIDTAGGFNLGAGSFEGAVIFESTTLHQGISTFEVSEAGSGDYPIIDFIGAASPYVPPTADEHLTPKKYVFDLYQSIPQDKIFEDISSVEVIDTGTGQVVITLDGAVAGVATQGLFGFGGNFVPSDLIHLKRAVSSAVRVENTASAETSRLTENSVGSSSSNIFYFMMNGAEAGRIDTSGNWGFGVPAAINEKIHVNGNIQLGNYIHIDTKAVPSDPPLEEARIYLKQRNAKNNELCCKLKKKVGGVGTMTEVLLTSPEAKCCVCGAEGSARDPYFDTVSGKMVIEFFCGHIFEMDVNYKLRK